jgi:hypothetical protein
MNPWSFVYGAIALSARSMAGLHHHQARDCDNQRAGEAAQRRLYANPGLEGSEIDDHHRQMWRNSETSALRCDCDRL